MDPKLLAAQFLRTFEDVKSFLLKYPDFTTKSEARKWLSFAKHNTLLKPPLLSILPEEFSLEVLAIREDYVRSFFMESNMAECGQFLTKVNEEVLEKLIDVSLQLPEDYLDMANDAVLPSGLEIKDVHWMC